MARLQDADALWRPASGHHRWWSRDTRRPGDQFTEAQASAAWLEAHGVPAAAIVEVGRRRLVDEPVATPPPPCTSGGSTKVLIVTDGFHEDRSLAIATNVGLQAWPVPATDSPIKGWATVPYFAKETVGVALGRIIGYHLHGSAAHRRLAAGSSRSSDRLAATPIRGWCNRQHGRFWPCYWGFESSPPSQSSSPGPTAVGLGCVTGAARPRRRSGLGRSEAAVPSDRHLGPSDSLTRPERVPGPIV